MDVDDTESVAAEVRTDAERGDAEAEWSLTVSLAYVGPAGRCATVHCGGGQHAPSG